MHVRAEAFFRWRDTSRDEINAADLATAMFSTSFSSQRCFNAVAFAHKWKREVIDMRLRSMSCPQKGLICARTRAKRRRAPRAVRARRVASRAQRRRCARPHCAHGAAHEGGRPLLLVCHRQLAHTYGELWLRAGGAMPLGRLLHCRCATLHAPRPLPPMTKRPALNPAAALSPRAAGYETEGDINTGVWGAALLLGA